MENGQWGAEVHTSQPPWTLPTLLNTLHLTSNAVVGATVVGGWVLQW